MAKTVFGMPGVGKQEPEGGDAVAPGGTPGAKQGSSGLPQKSGKEQPKLPLKPVQKPAPAKKPQKPESVPPMAKPSRPPEGKPKDSKGPPAGGKTMFGMPAVKLPGQPGGSPLPAPGDTTQPIGSAGDIFSSPAAAPTTPAADPASAPQGELEDDDAFKATVLGMAAADVSTGSEPVVAAPTPQAAGGIENLGSSPIPQPNTAGTLPKGPDIGEETSSIRIGVGSTGKGSLPKWAIAAIIAVIAVGLFLVGFFVLGDSGASDSEIESAPSGAPPTP